MLKVLKERYAAGYVNEDGIRAEIKRTWEEDHYLMDTHTAVASAVLRDYIEKTGDKTPAVIVPKASVAPPMSGVTAPPPETAVMSRPDMRLPLPGSADSAIE